MNLCWVPYLAHAGLALSIGLGALLNAGWLLVGLIRMGRYKPQPGWKVFGARVVLATGLLTGFLYAVTLQFDWIAARQQVALRLGVMALVLLGSAVIYFGCLRLTGLRLKSFARR
jgi:putative peptidoglycan lipid II flippase